MYIKTEKNAILIYLYTNTKNRFEHIDRLELESATSISSNSPSFGLLQKHGYIETTKTTVGLSDYGRLYCEENLMGLINPIKEQNKFNHYSLEQKTDLVVKFLYDNYKEINASVNQAAPRCGFTPSNQDAILIENELITSKLFDYWQNDYRDYQLELSPQGYKCLLLVNGSFSKWKEESAKLEAEESQAKKENERPLYYQSIGVNYGITNQDSDLRESRLTNSPANNPINPPIKNDGKKSLWMKVSKEAWNIIAGVLILVIGGYIVWRMGWLH